MSKLQVTLHYEPRLGCHWSWWKAASRFNSRPPESMVSRWFTSGSKAMFWNSAGIGYLEDVSTTLMALMSIYLTGFFNYAAGLKTPTHSFNQV